ncbi:MAG TPA: methyltransferase domain-containing protein [Bryobacteraceae bacterium]|nr:methyltransferase domain-containing protein [Bryobacteraceae bacterium]
MIAWLAAISAHFRRRRMARFVRTMGITPQTRVLDVGGTPDSWQSLPAPPRVILLNAPRARQELGAATSWVAGDGRSLPFRDGAFDVVFSNSVIEHVGDSGSQVRFARETMRAGRRFWVQTPNRWFPVEQHLLLPLVHWLPRRWQRRLAPRLSLAHAALRLTPDRREFYMRHYLEDVHLLDARGLRALFPGARLVRERFCGWTKSLIIHGGEK